MLTSLASASASAGRGWRRHRATGGP
jgi:hypothetical protein